MRKQSFYDSLLETVQTYIRCNMGCDNADGLFISKTLEIMLVKKDEIYQPGDFYALNELICKQQDGENITVTPNKRRLDEIAQKYN